MKGIKLSTISKAAGAAAGVISIASVSAWISTKYLLRMALDREEPVLLKAAEKRISGTEQDNGFIRAMQESAKHLEEKPNETISIMSYDGEQLVGHWIPVEMTYENYQACSAPKRLFVVPGADHGMSYYLEPQKYEREMKLFWKEYDS